MGELLAVVEGFPHMMWMFRGQADIDWPLLPKAGREEYYIPNRAGEEAYFPNQDLVRFEQWRHAAIAYHPSLPENLFDCLACAQHYGLATRLLDWTANPLIAMFFAVEEQPSRDGGLFVYLPELDKDLRGREMSQVDRTVRFTPRPLDKRILNQSASFTFHPKPNVPLKPDLLPSLLGPYAPEGTASNLVRLRIPAGAKKWAAAQLDQLGINRRTLFPDLDGLSSFINWQTKQVAGRRPATDPTEPPYEIVPI